MNDTVDTPAQILAGAIDKLSGLLASSTPGDPGWHVKENDLIGGTCVMPENETPCDSDQNSIADFMNEADAKLIVVLRALAPTLLASFRQILDVHLNSVPLPFDGDADVWPVPVHILAQARAVLSA